MLREEKICLDEKNYFCRADISVFSTKPDYFDNSILHFSSFCVIFSALYQECDANIL